MRYDIEEDTSSSDSNMLISDDEYDDEEDNDDENDDEDNDDEPNDMNSDVAFSQPMDSGLCFLCGMTLIGRPLTPAYGLQMILARSWDAP